VDPFDYAKSLAEMWAMGGKALLSAQQTAAQAMEAALSPGALPDFSSAGIDIAEFQRAVQSMTELWSSVTALSQTLLRGMPASARDATVEATFEKIADPRSWFGVTGEMDEFLAHMAEGPRFSDMLNAERKFARVYRAWLNLRQRGLEQASVVLEGWQRAARRFAEEVPKSGASGDGDAMLKLWVETANQVLLEMQRSEPFLKAQAEMIRASTELRMAQQELAEFYSEQFGFPTRRELDDIYKAVTELRRELRAMRRAGKSQPRAKVRAKAGD
jgi:polyhydroxyalkanoate synthase subunit PhaE